MTLHTPTRTPTTICRSHCSVFDSTRCLGLAVTACHCLCYRAKEVYEFAYTYPYSYSQLQRWLLTWQRLQLPYLQRHLLCRSPHMKRVDVLVIEDASTDVGQSTFCSSSGHACTHGFNSLIQLCNHPFMHLSVSPIHLFVCSSIHPSVYQHID